MKPYRTKKQQSDTQKNFVRFTAPKIAGVLALALLPLTAHAQRGGGMSGGGGMGSGGRGGGSAPSYSAPSYSRPSYSAPSYSRPSYSSPSYSAPSYSRPSYSGPSYSSTRAGGDFGSAYGRSQPSYNYNSPQSGSYRYQQSGGQIGQAQSGRAPVQGSGQYGQGTGRIQGQGSALPGQGTGTGRTPGQGTNQTGQSPVYGYRPPSSAITQTGGRTINRIVSFNNVNNSYNRFYNSAEARRYRYGVPHGDRYYYGGYGFGAYFGAGLAFYPFYSPFFSVGYTVLSPYAFYDGVFPPYINYGGVYIAPPAYTYVPYPVYQDGSYNGYRGDDVDGYYLNQNYGNGGQYRVGENGQTTQPQVAPPQTAPQVAPQPIPKDAALDSTLNDIKEAWKTGKIDTLAKHVRRDAKVAVYLRGKYQYSLDAGDYLDMTRDALTMTKTVRFELDDAQRKQKGVYTLSGRHVYQDKDGKEHTVYISYVLEQVDNDYVITQVGSAPDKVEE